MELRRRDGSVTLLLSGWIARHTLRGGGLAARVDDDAAESFTRSCVNPMTSTRSFRTLEFAALRIFEALRLQVRLHRPQLLLYPARLALSSPASCMAALAPIAICPSSSGPRAADSRDRTC